MFNPSRQNLPKGILTVTWAIRINNIILKRIGRNNRYHFSPMSIFYIYYLLNCTENFV